MRRLVAFLAVVSIVAAVTAPARADGDPASDYLLGQEVFFPFDAKFPAKEQAQFAALVAAANQGGYKIRVALIAGSYDMGSVTSLWRRPKTYARFLGQELSFLYKGRLLVVMPNGYGFSWIGHTAVSEYAVLGKLPPPGTPANLLSSAQVAVQRLAASAGVSVKPPAHVTTPGARSSHDRIVIIVAVAVFVVAAASVRLALRRLRR
jgi:hypothetical protein